VKIERWAYNLLLSLGGEVLAAEIRHVEIFGFGVVWFKKVVVCLVSGV
jgi:hypothetical protein